MVDVEKFAGIVRSLWNFVEVEMLFGVLDAAERRVRSCWVKMFFLARRGMILLAHCQGAHVRKFGTGGSPRDGW